MRTTFLFLMLLAALLAAVPAYAGDEPTPAELATMILGGNDAEHALVARWLEEADRATLKAVFKELRARKQQRVPSRVPPGFAPPPPPERKLVNAEVRVIDVPAASAAAFLGNLRPTAEQQAVPLTADDAARLLRATDAREDVKLVSAPRVSVYDGQQANVSVLNQVSYVQDFDVEVKKDGGMIVIPIVQVIQEGTLIDFRPSLDAQGKTIALSFEGTFAAITRPIPEKEVELPGSLGHKVMVQLPELKVMRVKTTVTLPDGGWVLIGGGVLLEPAKGEIYERVTLVHLKTP